MSVNGSYTFCNACGEVFKTLVIKMFLRTLLAYYVKISVISVNGSYTFSAMYVEWCLRTFLIKMFGRMLLSYYLEKSVLSVNGSYTHFVMLIA